MTDDEVSGFLTAYRTGQTADVIQFDFGTGWGAMFTVPSSSPMALERVGTQFLRLRAKRLRYVRQARLRSQTGENLYVVIITVLPDEEQRVYDLATSNPVQVRYLRDTALNALEQAGGIQMSKIR